ncbi:MAG: helix-turn-helix domain-containing protein [Gammaproteobacteria bacterium]|nr:helix-turn-helix domain-containing protein [Gammaproteobacteria bacterium]MCW8994095.1 helix-turn-helix domain-containing protein [Gammaproteobacteria bacterium]
MQTQPEHRPEKQTETRLRERAVECCSCGLFGLCKVAGLDEPQSDTFDQIVSTREEVPSGARLLTPRRRLDTLIAVRSGAFKLSTRPDGTQEQIVGFALPGELIGLEALSGSAYPFSVEALEASSVCRFNLTSMQLSQQHMAEFQQQLILALARQARAAQNIPMLLGAKNAEQRLALFLLDISSRLSEHGFPGQRFRLPMSRQSIANYLGLAMETVSRVFKRFHARGIIDVRARHIALADLEQLRTIASTAM